MKDRTPESGPNESGIEPKFSRTESLPEEQESATEPMAETPEAKPGRGLRLVSNIDEIDTLDQRRAELSKMSSAILEENWKLELADLEAKEAEYVRSNVMERIADGSLDARVKEKKISLRERVDRFLRKRMTDAEKQQDIKEVLYQDWQEVLEAEMEEVIDGYLDFHLAHVAKVLPEFNQEFFASKITELSVRAEKILATSKKGSEIDEKDFLAVNMVKNEMRVLQEMFLFAVNEEANRKFAPLVSRARGDVRMFLVEHINKAGLAPEEAQHFLKEKLEEEPMFFFLPELTSKNSKQFVLGQTDTKYRVEINLGGLGFLENRRLDDAQLATTAIHELVHTVSAKSPEGKLGLSQYEEFFKGVVQGKEIYKPSDYLNELATELLALEIAAKYYKPDAPGTIKLAAPEKQKYVGYASMIRAFKDLDKKYGNRVQELKDILISVMVRGDDKKVIPYEKLKSFLLQNEELFAEVREICAKSAAPPEEE